MKMENKVLFIGFVILTAVLLIPFPSLDAPDWTITVLYGPIEPASGALVREDYQNYSWESQEHEVELVADAAGKVHFPARRVYRNILMRAFGFVRALAGVHASFGPHDSVLAFAGNMQGDIEKNGMIFDWTGSPPQLESVILLHSNSH